MGLLARLLTPALSALVAVLTVAAGLQPAVAQQPGYGQTLQRAGEPGGGASSLGPGMGKGNSVLDAVNPMDLMNKIRRSQVLDDATSPTDAVDQALRDYSGQMGPAAASPGQAVKAP